PAPARRAPDGAKPTRVARFPLGGMARGFLLLEDGKRIAWLQGERSVVLTDLATSEARSPPVPGKGRLTSLASPDGNALVARDESGQLWSVAQGAAIPPYRAGPAIVSAVGYSADGRLVAVGGERGGIGLHEAASGRLVFQREKERPAWLALSPDGQ